MVQDDGPGLADESDFLGAIVAAERIAQWMEILSNDGMALSRKKAAAMELAEAVQKDEAYADEAFQQCAPNDVAALLDAINMEYADPATLEYAGALQEALKVFREQTDAGRKTIHKFSFRGVEVKVARAGLSEGLGGRVWESSLLLCDRLASSTVSTVRGASVLELGSGCGVCGVYAALREAQSVTLTDHHPATLATLRCSVTLNPSLSQPVSVAFLDWDNERALVATPAQRPDAAGRAAGGGDAAAAAAAAAALPPPRAVPSDPEGKPFPVVPEQQRFDVILAADVLYETGQAMSLAAAIAHRLDPRGWCRVVVPVRSAALLEAFIDEARSFGLRVTTSPIDEAARAAAMASAPHARTSATAGAAVAASARAISPRGSLRAASPPDSFRAASPPGSFRAFPAAGAGSPRTSSVSVGGRPTSGGGSLRSAHPPSVVEVVERIASQRPGSPAHMQMAEYEGGFVEMEIDWGGELFGSQVLRHCESSGTPTVGGR